MVLQIERSSAPPVLWPATLNLSSAASYVPEPPYNIFTIQMACLWHIHHAAGAEPHQDTQGTPAGGLPGPWAEPAVPGGCPSGGLPA